LNDKLGQQYPPPRPDIVTRPALSYDKREEEDACFVDF
jgi:hypothetical protein